LVFGHSMGGAITGLLAAAGRLNARGLALSAPAARTGPKVFPLLRHLARIVGTLAPKLRIVRMGHGFVSRDPQVVEQFANDPLVFHGRIPCRTGAEILAAAPRLLRSAPRIRLPLLILQGTGDVVVDFRGAEELHRRAGSPDKTLKLYPGLYHDLVNEPERQQVLDDLVEWLDAHRQ
jgi:acylglycerol lipase